MLIGLLVAMVFAAVVLLVYGLLSTVFSDEVIVRKSLKALDAYEVEDLFVVEPMAKPFFDRVIRPFYGGLSAIAKLINPKGAEANINVKLVRAGNPKDMNADRFLSLKLMLALIAVAFAILLFVIAKNSFGLLLFSLVLISAAYFAPDLWLRDLIQTREKNIRLALADTLDLLTISVEAGLGFDIALAKVIKNYPGPLAEEFSRMLHEVQVGVTRKDALKNLADRVNVDEVRNFVASIIQADTFGVSIGNVLRVQASESRLKRRQYAEEAAQKAPVKLVFPLIFCIFPALFVVLIGPGVIRIAATFSSFMK